MKLHDFMMSQWDDNFPEKSPEKHLEKAPLFSINTDEEDAAHWMDFSEDTS